MARKIKINCFKITPSGELMVIFNNGTLWFPRENQGVDENRLSKALTYMDEIADRTLEIEGNL